MSRLRGFAIIKLGVKYEGKFMNSPELVPSWKKGKPSWKIWRPSWKNWAPSWNL